MISYADFITAMQPITKKWKYTTDEIDLIFKAVMNVELQRLEGFVMNMLRTSQSRPTIRVFETFGRNAQPKREDSPKPVTMACYECNDKGILFLIEKSTSNTTYCKCSCAKGMSEPWKLPVWGRDLEQKFEANALPPGQFVPKTESAFEIMKSWTAKMRTAELFWMPKEKVSG